MIIIIIIIICAQKREDRMVRWEELCQKTIRVVEHERNAVCGQLLRMNKNKLAKRIFKFPRQRKRESKWFRVMKVDLVKMGVTEKDRRFGQKRRSSAVSSR